MIATAISTFVRQHGETTAEIAPKVQASAQGSHEVSRDIGAVTKSADDNEVGDSVRGRPSRARPNDVGFGAPAFTRLGFDLRHERFGQ
jgi:hypothetical protein